VTKNIIKTFSRNESGRFGALKSDSTHQFFRNACIKLKNWWVESDFKAPNLPLSLRLKVLMMFLVTTHR
jgi:hypothetical protein